MSMKTQFITLKQTKPGADAYRVDALVNAIEPKVGSILPPVEVRRLIKQRDTKVTIKAATLRDGRDRGMAA